MAGVRLRGNLTLICWIAWDGTTYVDETANVKRFSLARGYAEDQSQVQAGTCSLTLKDTTGRFNPANAASVLAPYIAYPLRPMLLSVTYSSTTYRLFTGWTTKHESDPGKDAREARIDCADAFVLLDGVKPVIGGAATTTGGAINFLLDAAGFPGGARAMDNGDTIVWDGADGGATALARIGDLLTTERGFFFMAKDGTATYLDRGWTNTSPYNASQGTIAGTMRSIAPGVDLALIRNRATVTATGGTAQTAGDATSIARYGTRDYGAITSPYLSGDAAAGFLASYLVNTNKDPLPPVRQIDIGQHDSATLTQLLARELGDYVTVSEGVGGTSGAYHIRRITIDGNATKGEFTGSWTLRQRNTAFQPFVIGQSSVGGTDYITY